MHHHIPAPSGVYLWDIPTVSLYLAISNHVAAAAVLSLTLSLSAGISIPRPCVRRRFLHIQPPSPLPLAPQSQMSVATPLRPTHPPPRPSPSPSPAPVASSLPRRAGRFGLTSVVSFPAWCVACVREVGRRRLDVGLHSRALQGARRAGATGLPTRTRRSGVRLSSGGDSDEYARQ